MNVKVNVEVHVKVKVNVTLDVKVRVKVTVLVNLLSKSIQTPSEQVNSEELQELRERSSIWS